MKDYYKTLEINRNASQEEVKKAYHRLAHRYHPDKKTGDEEKFKEINEAYQILGDKKKRVLYDQGGFQQSGSQWARGGAGFSNFRFDPRSFNFNTANNDNLNDILEELGGLFNFGFRRNSQNENYRRGESIQISLQIPLKETLYQSFKEITINKKNICPRCEGIGAEPGTSLKECPTCRGKGKIPKIQQSMFGSFTRYSICPECNGRGKIPVHRCNICHGKGIIENLTKMRIPIPPGVDSGQVIKLAGQGNSAPYQGIAGDLYVKIIVENNPIFQRRGDNLLEVVRVSFSQAVLGGSIKIPTLEGKDVSVVIPKAFDFDKIIKIGKQGIPHFNRPGRGDLLVQLKVKIPKKLSPEQKRLIKELKIEGL